MPLPSLPPIDTAEFARYRTTQLRRASSRELVERARAIPPPAYRGPPEAAPLAPVPSQPAGAEQPPPAPALPAPLPGARPAGPLPEDLVPSQLAPGQELTTAQAMAACGPAAAVAFARRQGRNPTLREAVDLAKGEGWTEAQGMAGPASQQRLLAKMGIAARLEPGVDWAKVRADVEGGNPVTISTPRHYFVATAYNPETDQFNFQASGEVLKGGGRWLKPAQVVSLGNGLQGALYLDNPEPGTAPSLAAAPRGAPTAQHAATDEGLAAQKYGLDPDIFFRQISQESGGRANAVSPAGARGVGQFMPGTAAAVAARMGGGVTAEQIMGDKAVGLDAAAFHMREMLDSYGGDYAKALAAYNAGPGAVAKYGGVPPFKETQTYIQRILGDERPIAGPAVAAPVPPAPAVQAATTGPPGAPPRTYGSPQEQLADLMTRYGQGAPAADFAAGAEAQLADLGRRYGLPPVAPRGATSLAAPPATVPDYQAIAQQQLAQTAQNRAARAYVAPPPEPEPEPEPVYTPPPLEPLEPEPLPVTGDADRGIGLGPAPLPPMAPTGDADLGIGLGPPLGSPAPTWAEQRQAAFPEPPLPQPLPPPVEPSAPVPEPMPLPPPEPVGPTWAEQRQEAFAPPVQPPPASGPVAPEWAEQRQEAFAVPASPPPQPQPEPNPFERVGRALVDALKGVPELTPATPVNLASQAVRGVGEAALTGRSPLDIGAAGAETASTAGLNVPLRAITAQEQEAEQYRAAEGPGVPSQVGLGYEAAYERQLRAVIDQYGPESPQALEIEAAHNQIAAGIHDPNFWVQAERDPNLRRNVAITTGALTPFLGGVTGSGLATAGAVASQYGGFAAPAIVGALGGTPEDQATASELTQVAAFAPAVGRAVVRAAPGVARGAADAARTLQGALRLPSWEETVAGLAGRIPGVTAQGLINDPTAASAIARQAPMLDGPELDRALRGLTDPESPIITIATGHEQPGKMVLEPTTWQLVNGMPEALGAGFKQDDYLYVSQVPRASLAELPAAEAVARKTEILRANQIGYFDPQTSQVGLFTEKRALQAADPSELVNPAFGKQLESVGQADIPHINQPMGKPGDVRGGFQTLADLVERGESYQAVQIARWMEEAGGDYPAVEQLRTLRGAPGGEWSKTNQALRGTPVPVEQLEAKVLANAEMRPWYLKAGTLFNELAGGDGATLDWLASLWGELASSIGPGRGLDSTVHAAQIMTDLAAQGRLTKGSFTAEFAKTNAYSTPVMTANLWKLTEEGLHVTTPSSSKTPFFTIGTRDRAPGRIGEYMPVNDRHNYRAVGYSAPNGPLGAGPANAAGSDYTSGVILAIAQKIGWAPDEVQAALWFAQKYPKGMPTKFKVGQLGSIEDAAQFVGQERLDRLTQSLREAGRVPLGEAGAKEGPRYVSGGQPDWRRVIPGEAQPVTGAQIAGGAVRGGIAGGYGAQQEPEASPQDILKGAILGAVRGGVTTGARLPTGSAVRLALRAERLTPQETIERLRAAAGSAPLELPLPPGSAPPPPLPPRPLLGAVGAAEGAAREFAGNIRLEKFQSDDVRAMIAQTFDAHPDLMESARRGVVPDEVVADLAQQVGMQVDDLVKRWKPGDAENAETIYALRQTLFDQSARVTGAKALYREALGTGGDVRPALGQIAEEITRYKAIQEAVHGVVAEAGRALRQQRLPVTGFGPGVLEATAQQRQLDILLGQFTKEGGSLDDFAKFIADVDLSDADAVRKASAALYHPELGDYARWYWYYNLLSSPLGRVRDVASSALTTLTVPIEHAVAAPFHTVLRTGGGLSLKDLPGEYAAMGGGVSRGARAGLEILRTGFSPLEGFLGGAGIDVRRAAVREPVRGALPNLPSRIIRATDAFFKSVNYEGAIYHQAKVLSKGDEAEFLRLVREPTEAMVQNAIREAKYRTFQQDGTLVENMSRIKHLPGVGPVVTFMVPFHQTPYNLAKYAFERTPFGLAPIGADIARTVGAKVGVPGVTRPTTTRAQQAERLGRVAMGSALLLGFEQLSEDVLTGAAPKDSAERDAFYRQGKQPYAVRIGDQWRSYQGLQPFSTILGGVATIRDAVKQGNLDGALEAHTLLAFAFAQTIFDQSMLTGITSLSRAIDDPERFAEQWFEQTVRSAIPASAFWSNVARVTDNVLRDPEGPVETAMTVVPGLAQQVPARLDALGNPVERSPGQQGLGGLLDITKPTPVKNDPVENELARLQDVGKGQGFTVEPGFVGKKVGLGQGLPEVELTAEERARYGATSGRLAYGILAMMIQGPDWVQMDDTVKARIVRDVIAQTRESTREGLKPQLIPRGVEAFKKQSGAK